MQSSSSDNCMHRYNIMVLNLFDPELILISTKPIIKNILKELLSKLKKFEVLAILVYKKIIFCRIFHSCTKLIAFNSDIDGAFKSMHQSIITKIKNYACENWIVLDVIIKPTVKTFGC